MPTVSNVRAKPHYWPAVPEQVRGSIREEITLLTAADMETHFRSLGEPEGMRRTVRVFIGEKPSARASSSKTGSSTNPYCGSLTTPWR